MEVVAITEVKITAVVMDLTKTVKKKLKCGTWNSVNASTSTSVRTSVSLLSSRTQS
jgi:hypothetical protein